MNRWGLMSTVAVALAVGWGVVLTAPGVAYAEMTLPEERLAQQLLAGDVSAARGEFDHLLASLMTGLDQLATRPAETTTALAARANTLRRAVMVLETWEGAELWSRSRGQGAPAATVDRMVAAVDALDVHGREIERLKGNVAAPAAEDHRTRDLRDVGRDVGRLWLQSTAFVRSTSADHRRSQFLAAARHWVATPATVQEFDARFGDDPQKAFNLRPVSPTDRGGRRKGSAADLPRQHRGDRRINTARGGGRSPSEQNGRQPSSVVLQGRVGPGWLGETG